MLKNTENNTGLGMDEKGTLFLIDFCKDNTLRYSFFNKGEKHAFDETKNWSFSFLNEFLSNIYSYLLAYDEKEIEHNGYYSAVIQIGDAGTIIDVEFKFTKPSIIGFRIWKRPERTSPNSKSESIFKTQLPVYDFVTMAITGYSNFLEKYGLTIIAKRFGKREFPLIALLKLLHYMEEYKVNPSVNFKVLGSDIPLSVELKLLNNLNNLKKT